MENTITSYPSLIISNTLIKYTSTDEGVLPTRFIRTLFDLNHDHNEV